jgi:glycogen synthase
MKGFPKHLKTRFDVEYCLEHYPVETKASLTQKLAEVKQWQVTSKLAEGDAGTTDATHKVVEVKDQVTKEIKERYQHEYKDDPNCELFKLGFTVKEAEDILVKKEAK